MNFFFFLCMFLGNQWFIFVIFFLCCPSQRSARSQVPSLGGNPPGDWQSAVGWGDAGFEPGTAGQHPGALPLSYHTSLIELPHLPNSLTWTLPPPPSPLPTALRIIRSRCQETPPARKFLVWKHLVYVHNILSRKMSEYICGIVEDLLDFAR